jgi:hypothetical protein
MIIPEGDTEAETEDMGNEDDIREVKISSVSTAVASTIWPVTARSQEIHQQEEESQKRETQ